MIPISRYCVKAIRPTLRLGAYCVTDSDCASGLCDLPLALAGDSKEQTPALSKAQMSQLSIDPSPSCGLQAAR